MDQETPKEFKVQLRVVGIYFNTEVTLTDNPNPTVKDVLDQAVKDSDGKFFYIGTKFENGASIDVIGHQFDGNRNLNFPCLDVPAREVDAELPVEACEAPIQNPRPRTPGWYIISDALGEEPEAAWQYYILDKECRELSTKGKFVPFNCSNDIGSGGIQIQNGDKIIFRCLCILTQPTNLQKRYIQRLDQILKDKSDPNLIVGSNNTSLR